jgi:hypothetical protein
MSWQEETLKRIDDLIEQGRGISRSAGRGESFGLFIGWATQAKSLLQSLLDSKSPYVSEFTKYAIPQNGTEPTVQILTRLRSDVASGYLRTTVNIISAEVFGDFLEIAQHLLDEGYKDPAASLAGAVLEDGLRRIARNNDITVSGRDDLTSLRDKCAGKQIFNNLVRQQITAWTTLRNSADHGNFAEYTAQQVGSMISDVRAFLAKHLG